MLHVYVLHAQRIVYIHRSIGISGAEYIHISLNINSITVNCEASEEGRMAEAYIKLMYFYAVCMFMLYFWEQLDIYCIQNVEVCRVDVL